MTIAPNRPMPTTFVQRRRGIVKDESATTISSEIGTLIQVGRRSLTQTSLFGWRSKSMDKSTTPLNKLFSPITRRVAITFWGYS